MPSTTYKGLEVQVTGSNSGTWGSVLNTQALEYLDLNLGGIITVALTNVNVTLSATQSRSVLIRLTGTLTGNVVITTACMGFFVVTNATTGAFTVNFTNGTGTSAEAVQGFSTLIVSDSTNGCRAGNDAPGDVFVASGASASEGLVPDPGATAGTGRYLREDATFVVPPFQWTPSGRLTLTSGTPVTTSDVTAATAVYYTAMNGNTVPVYGSCASAPTQFAPVTITGGELTLTLNNPNHAANTNYDVFCFLDGSTVRIGSGPPWTSSTARGTGAGTTQISLASGLWTNTVSLTARNGASTYAVAAGAGTYLGTIRTGSTAGTTEDSRSNRFVFNAFNGVKRGLYVVESTNSWSYNTATWRQANGSTSNQVSIVQGLQQNYVSANVVVAYTNTGGGTIAVGVGINSTSVNSAKTFGVLPNGSSQMSAFYEDYPVLGLSVIAWLETADGNPTTWYGDNGTTRMASGLTAQCIA